eukprot:TRINITY_DN17642_c0_g1_i1.p1 TRINITY_DN17642_c0_g1~~TRINITY_DN17642_c0_g1_i1.p1  ORF type:complete len:384 (+),score=77.12 TRINITY_DN17642_c0_g1_i1:84-1154(+)
MGFKNGEWEFCMKGEEIYRDMMETTHGKGVLLLSLNERNWPVSDDTVMALGTAEGLADAAEQDYWHTLQSVAKGYQRCWGDMCGRAPGGTCAMGVHHLNGDCSNWDQLPFCRSSGGCGGAMRAMPIGLRFCRPEDMQTLIAVAVDAGRITHHHPAGFMGSVTAALFTAYAIQGVPPKDWGWKLMEEALPMVKDYLRASDRHTEKNLGAFEFFEDKWNAYLEARHIRRADSAPLFPERWDFVARDTFYKMFSYDNWAGSSGVDAPLVALDAVLWAGADWEKLCHSGILHGGDSDSTGCIAGALFGALHGLVGVPECHTARLEYRDRLAALGARLYTAAQAGLPAPLPACVAQQHTPQ